MLLVYQVDFTCNSQARHCSSIPSKLLFLHMSKPGAGSAGPLHCRNSSGWADFVTQGSHPPWASRLESPSHRRAKGQESKPKHTRSCKDWTQNTHTVTLPLPRAKISHTAQSQGELKSTSPLKWKERQSPVTKRMSTDRG